MALMTNYERMLELDKGINAQTVKNVIDSYNIERERAYKDYQRYAADDVPIFNRTFKNSDKINNKINNDFISDIVDTKVGYMVGKPIIYSTTNESVQSKLSLFERINNLEDLDAESVKLASITGKSYRLIYIDTNGMLRAKNIDPWEVIYIKDINDDVKYAVRVVALSSKYNKVYVYSIDDVYVYEDLGGSYTLNIEESKPNFFNKVPIVEFLNNEEMKGDCFKVLDLIDGYDRALSDVNSEIEQFRLAYLALMGVEFDSTQIEEMQRTGAFSLPEGTDAKFITKQLDDNIIEHHLDRIEKNIYKFAKSVDFTSDNFATVSGIALKYKMQSLDNKVLTSQRKFGVGLYQMFELCYQYWNVSMNYDTNDIMWTFRRNIPIDILDEAESTNKLKGYVSEQTRLSQLTFINDVEKEIEDIKENIGVSEVL